MLNLTLIIGVVVLIGATAPFWHIWANKVSTKEFMGFTNLQSFLYAFGTHFAYFCGASFFFWIRHFITQEFKSVIRIINVIGGVFTGISAYFLLWVFAPATDFPRYIYNVTFTVSALFIAYGMYLFNNFIIGVVLYGRENTKRLVNFAFRTRNKHYKRVAIKAMYAETYKTPLPAKDTVEENAIAFEKDLFDTLGKVVDNMPNQ